MVRASRGTDSCPPHATDGNGKGLLEFAVEDKTVRARRKSESDGAPVEDRGNHDDGCSASLLDDRAQVAGTRFRAMVDDQCTTGARVTRDVPTSRRLLGDVDSPASERRGDALPSTARGIRDPHGRSGESRSRARLRVPS